MKLNLKPCTLIQDDPRYGLVKWINEKKNNESVKQNNEEQKEVQFYNAVELINFTLTSKDEVLETNKEYTIKYGDTFHKGELIMISK